MVPTVTVIMPMHNARPFVADALASVLAERDVPLEVVVVDDASSDGSAEVVRQVGDERVRLVAGPGEGISRAFNAALAAARGQIVMRCDADDQYPSGRIARQIGWLKEHSDHVAVCGRFATIDARSRMLAELGTDHASGPIEDELRQGATRTHLCTYAIRTNVLRELGGCRSWFVTAEDVDLQLRVGGAGPVWFEAELAYLYRLHDASITHRQADPVRSFYEQTARRCARQRAAGQTDDIDAGRPPQVPQVDHVSTSSATAQAQEHLMGEAWRRFRTGSRGPALRLAWRACLKRPTNLRAWRSLAAMCARRRSQPS